MRLDFKKIDELVEQGYITKRKHPDADLYILNYTPKTQYEQNWTPETMACRGLIVDGNNKIVSRPFEKFFNIEEHVAKGMPALPWSKTPLLIQEKMDGSLGISYWVEGELMPRIATRGSFESEQAKVGTEILRDRYADRDFDPEYTYLFEIIYPENRIVVDYEGSRDIVLLAIKHTETGEEDYGQMMTAGFTNEFLTPELYPASTPPEKLRELVPNDGSTEGLVLRFADGRRVKLKTEEYVRLHRLLTQVSSKSIWDLLRNGEDVEQVIDNVPDEFYQWVKDTRDTLQRQHDAIIEQSKTIYKEIEKLPDRKTQAQHLKDVDQPYPAIIFAMLDGKEYDHIAWKFVKPKYEQPFRKDIDA